MANIRRELECDICNQILSVRIQPSNFLNNYPVNINCGKCKSEITFNVEEDKIVEPIINAKETFTFNKKESVYFYELAGDFFTNKMKYYNSLEETFNNLPITPFISTMKNIKNYNEFENYIKKIILFLTKKADWITVKTINELWLNNNIKYINKKALPLLKKWNIDNANIPRVFSLENKYEIERTVQYINFWYFKDLLLNQEIVKELNNLKFEINNLNNSNTYLDFLNYLSQNKICNFYEKKLFSVQEKFTNLFEKLIPEFLLPLLKKVNFEKIGMTTISFNELKDFYVNCYEDLLEVSNLVFALNNLYYRNDFNLMKINSKITLIDMIEHGKVDKGKKIKDYLSGQEKFDKIIYKYFDSELRNAFIHKSFNYDTKKQLITYTSKGSLINSKDKKEIYLVELANKCINLLYCFIYLKEIIHILNILIITLFENSNLTIDDIKKK